jgi:CDP-diacylglycerol--serine O-phosphatidyltransferase
MFALKFKNLKWADNKIQYIFLSGCIVLLLLMGWNGFAPIIGWYILASAAIYPFMK